MEGDKEARGSLAVGSRFITTRRIACLERRMTSEVTESEPDKSWAHSGIDGPIRAITHITITPLPSGAGSQVTLAIDFQGHGIARLFVPLVRWLGYKDGPAICRNLKQQLEGHSE